MSKNAGNIVLEAKNVVYYYKANKGKKVLDDISYGFEIGKMYAILGPSGSGKTTFLSLLAGLDSPTDGGIYYEGVNIRKKGLHNYRKKNMSLVFQNYRLFDSRRKCDAGWKERHRENFGSGWNTEGRLETAGLTVIRRTAAASGYCKSISKSCEGIACR